MRYPRATIAVLVCMLTFSIVGGCSQDADQDRRESPVKQKELTAKQIELNEDLRHTIARGGSDSVEFLLQLGADPNARYEVSTGSADLITPLMLAANNGRSDVAAILLYAGAAINARDKNGRTALMYASARGRTETVEFLLNSGAPIDAIDDESRTALMLAAVSGHAPTVELLLARGADKRVRDKNGKDTWKLAEEGEGSDRMKRATAQGRASVVELLQR